MFVTACFGVSRGAVSFADQTVLVWPPTAERRESVVASLLQEPRLPRLDLQEIRLQAGDLAQVGLV